SIRKLLRMNWFCSGVSPATTASTASAASWPSAGSVISVALKAAPPRRARGSLNPVIVFLLEAGLEGGRAGFTGADAGDSQKVEDEDLAVADAPGLCSVTNGVAHLVGEVRIDGDFELELGQEMNRVFRAAIDFGMALLAPVASDFCDGHAVDIEGIERLSHLFQSRRLDDGNHQLHMCPFQCF